MCTLIYRHLRPLPQSVIQLKTEHIDDPKLGPFRIVEVSPCLLPVTEDGIPISKKIKRAILALSQKHTAVQEQRMPNEFAAKREEEGDADRGQPAADGLSNALPQKYAADSVVHHTDEGDNVRNVMP